MHFKKNDMTFGEVLTDLRKEIDFTQEEVAKKTGLTREMISQYENGYSFPPEQNLKRLADFYNVSVDYLLSRSSVRVLPSNMDEAFVEYKGQPITYSDLCNYILSFSEEDRVRLADYVSILKCKL